MAKLYAGTSGWSYPSWKPEFYPPKLASARFLEHYASRLNTVEVNYTFRHTASEKTQNNWAAATPAEFRFSFKAHQRITHMMKLRDAAEAARTFLASLQPMSEAGKVGVVLFQLPPFLKADGPLITDFLAGVPRGCRLAFEFRHTSWFADPILDILRQHNAAICVAESEKLETPDAVTADFSYYRLRKAEYSPAERGAIREKAAEHIEQGRDVFIYFKHEETPEGAIYAEELLGWK